MTDFLTNFLFVSDGLDTTAMVKISIEDVNDNRPVFYPSQYNVNIKENSQTGSEVVVVRATDHDSGNFGKVKYTVSSGNEQGLFSIDSASGKSAS